LQHVHLSIQRAVTTPSVIASSAVYYLRSSSFSFAWMFACLPNYLPAGLSILLLMKVKNLKSCLYCFLVLLVLLSL